jgi:hypothetical protein
MTDSSDTPEPFDGWKQVGAVEPGGPGGAAPDGDGAPCGPTDAGADPSLGRGGYPLEVEALFADRKHSRQGVTVPSIVAGVCGLLGLVLGPFLVADTPDRYLVLALDLVALAAGGLGVWTALRFRARFDWAVLGLLAGGVSLGLYLLFVVDPPTAPAGGT